MNSYVLRTRPAIGFEDMGNALPGSYDASCPPNSGNSNTIYVQAKRWQGTVGRPEIQRFAGALQGQRARKGIFITTSAFSSDAKAYAAGLQTTIVLVDGELLVQLMMDAGVGVTEAEAIRILRPDEDCFDGM